MMWKISKEEHSDLNFAIGCLYCNAISLDEFKKWLELVVKDMDVDYIPVYIYDLFDFEQPLFHIYQVLGFEIINDLSKSDEYAMSCIAYLREREVYDFNLSKEQAKSKLNDNLDIQNRFNKFFPYIHIY